MTHYNGEYRPFTTTEDDHSGIALVVTTLLGTYTVLCCTVRMITRFTATGPVGKDDLCCTIGTFLGTAQTITAGVAIHSGFGRDARPLRGADVLRTRQALFAAGLLYLLANAAAKCSVALLFARLLSKRSHVKVCYGVAAICAAWGLCAALAQGVVWSQVSRTSGYEDRRDTMTSWRTITAFNIIIEIMLALIPFWLVWGLQIKPSRKISVITIFSLRTPVIVAAICYLMYLSKTVQSPRPFLSDVPSFICMQVEMNYGLIASTFPTLKAWVGAFNTGWGTRDNAGVGGYDDSSYQLSMDRTTNTNNPGSAKRGRGSRVMDSGLVPSRHGQNRARITTSHRLSNGRSSEESDGSRIMIIRHVKTCEVSSEHAI
ncbi:hypothetical protein MBLNU13_g03866t1 [Cladosporium sp. NU13]